MRVILRNNLRVPVIGVTIGNFQSMLFDCLIDTGFSGSLAGFVYTNQSGFKQFSIKNVDFITPPVLLPEKNWTILANGNKVETWKGKVLCNFNQIYRVSEIILISVAKPQSIPLILGMSLLKAYKADLSIHFSSKSFSLNI